MQAFPHLIPRARNLLCAWRASGLNSLDSTLNNIELAIASLEMFDSPSIDPHLMELHAKYAALQRQISLKWM